MTMLNYRFSGHETFPCRYAWLPKALGAIQRDPEIFSNEDRAIADLGVGKNMVRAIRFWVEVTGVAELSRRVGFTITPVGELLLGRNGLDRFLEDRRTLWLLHWSLLSRVEEPLFAWDYLINRWAHPDINRTEVLRTFEQEAKRIDRKLSRVTLEQHFDVFLHTYTPTRGRKREFQEDNLDCPLVELELIERIGERRVGDGVGRHEPIYAFRREAKADITPELFSYCLFDYWSKRKPNEATLTFRDVSVAHGSIGQVFKLPEMDVRERLERLRDDSGGLFTYQESASIQRVICPDRLEISGLDLLAAVYRSDDAGECIAAEPPNATHRGNTVINRRTAKY
jgi:Protein of unknown function (DUF4007)